MHVFQDAYNSSDLPRGGVATIGNFDGVHRGQRAILERVVARAEELGVAPTVVTFHPHPLSCSFQNGTLAAFPWRKAAELVARGARFGRAPLCCGRGS